MDEMRERRCASVLTFVWEDVDAIRLAGDIKEVEVAGRSTARGRSSWRWVPPLLTLGLDDEQRLSAVAFSLCDLRRVLLQGPGHRGHRRC